jgi:RimJ/RimL family protein N-acetyltransferase
MNPDVRDLREPIALRNGMPALVRAIRADDRERLQTAFRGLDPESVYLRYFAYKPELSEADLDRLCNPDFRERVVLVVTLERGGDETIIGSGGYVVLDASHRAAEVAFAVEEDFHGQGIAGILLQTLERIATRDGIERFEAEVLTRNVAMRRVFARSGLSLHEEGVDDDVVRISLALPPSAADASR